MEIKSIKIGDLVLDGNHIAQIVSVTCDGIIGTTFNETSNIEVVEPIPLTPEILEKNGFELKPDGWIWSIEKEIEEENYIFIQFRKGCNEVRLCEINFVNKAMANFRKINYVHELQHILRLCGIDKEIDLNDTKNRVI